ncbi:MAG: hypothetical protein FWD78_12325 [Treponema sp.]|nr:hypothetical protein [Treponema sp.]
MKNIAKILVGVLAVFFLFSCGGGDTGPKIPSVDKLSIDTLNSIDLPDGIVPSSDADIMTAFNDAYSNLQSVDFGDYLPSSLSSVSTALSSSLSDSVTSIKNNISRADDSGSGSFDQSLMALDNDQVAELASRGITMKEGRVWGSYSGSDTTASIYANFKMKYLYDSDNDTYSVFTPPDCLKGQNNYNGFFNMFVNQNSLKMEIGAACSTALAYHNGNDGYSIKFIFDMGVVMSATINLNDQTENMGNPTYYGTLKVYDKDGNLKKTLNLTEDDVLGFNPNPPDEI